MGKCEKWTIAYRKRTGDTTLLTNTEEPFKAIPNTWRYWSADPFLFENQGKTYLFAELYDRLSLRGVLGCCELTDEGAGEWTVIIEAPFHLSYPHIFRHNNEIYMIPESFRSGKIILYKAENFPYQWKKVHDLADMIAVDSTVFVIGDVMYMITLRIVDRKSELVLITMNDKLEFVDHRVISSKEDPHVRPGGNIFYADNRIIRPAQDCSKGYGYALNFYNVDCIGSAEYSESLVAKILPENVQISGVQDPKGIHTYNFTDQYEVIDCKEYEFGLISKFARVVKMLRKRG